MLKAENLSKIFLSGSNIVNAVKNVDITIARGESIYIHGPSGAGKSTLMHVLGTLTAPTKGSVKFQDIEVTRLNERKRSRLRNSSFGFIFQFYHLLPELNVLENVMLPAMIKGGERISEIRSRALDIIGSVGMEDRIKHRAGELSGGETQRTAIARALINSPEVLFCDEPTGNLDSEMSKGIYELIKSVSRKNDMSVVLVSHQEIDRSFFDTEYFMKDGVLVKRTGLCDSDLEDIPKREERYGSENILKR